MTGNRSLRPSVRAGGGARRSIARQESEVRWVLVARYRVFLPLHSGGEQVRASLDHAHILRDIRGSSCEDRVVRFRNVQLEQVRRGEGCPARGAHAAVLDGVVGLEVLHVVELLLAAALELWENTAQGIGVAVVVEDALLGAEATNAVTIQDERIARTEQDATVLYVNLHDSFTRLTI